MLEKQVIKLEFIENTNSLAEYVDAVEESLLVRHPAVNVWSILDCCEHILLIERGVNYIFHKQTGRTERNPTERIEKIKNTFTDYDRKLTAGEPVAPLSAYSDRNTILSEIRNNRENILAMAHRNDLTYLCLGYEHMLFGFLTKVEWIYYCIYHTERHIHQMKMIEQQLKTKI
jgi:hypothetical protein